MVLCEETWAWIRFRLSSGIVKILHGEPTDDIMHEASMDVIRQELNKHSSLLERLFGDLSSTTCLRMAGS